VETTFLNLLVLAAFGLLVAVTGGIAYLTTAEWRDRRRQAQETRETRRSAGKRRR
jgi:CHASE3 domain sensor protein